ncbi:hypothetical protein TeGR_g1469 [Tetraparma gracilis]|uniref:Uncharacterized protein n=1 Tax=Tetraparma gracilis TaxID=2962635 RepID=A0ABQ6M5Z0_9STRA|nr:hypothetical protein TeGR_g1469 [Tetraparma gracilis]
MSKAVVYTGRVMPPYHGEFMKDEEVTDVTIANGDSAITTVGQHAFARSGITSLQWMEGVRKIGSWAFARRVDLRTIEGLGCEEMGKGCFFHCTLLQSMKGWPASTTVIPGRCLHDCTGMTTVDCDLTHVTSIGNGAFCEADR